jgi:hypothetical protein
MKLRFSCSCLGENNIKGHQNFWRHYSVDLNWIGINWYCSLLTLGRLTGVHRQIIGMI